MSYLRNLGGAIRQVGRSLMGSGYNAATQGRRTLHVASSTRSMSSLALSDGPMLTARARKAVMDNPLAANGVMSFIGEVVGTGIQPRFLHPDSGVRRKLQKEWSRWTPQASATRRAGPDGPVSMQSFYGLQALVCRNVIEAGEAFSRLRPRLPQDGLRVPLQLEMIEPEQLPFWLQAGQGVAQGNQVRGGIEFDAIGQRVAYHFYRHHPGDATIWPNTYEITRVPAANVLQVMEYLRGDQIRGITSLASILIPLGDMAEYSDAERFKKMLGSYLFMWKKTALPDDPNLGAVSLTAGSEQAPEGTAFVTAHKGQVTVLDTATGEDMGFFTPPEVGTSYDVYMRNETEKIATVLRNTYEMLTGNMNQVNYSSARVRLITLRRLWRQFQTFVLVDQFCSPVVNAWLDAAALAGVLPAGDYLRNRDDYRAVDWRPQRWEYVNPKDDIEADLMEVAACLESRSAKIAERGGDADEVDEQVAKDQERERRLNIKPVYGRATNNQQGGQQ